MTKDVREENLSPSLSVVKEAAINKVKEIYGVPVKWYEEY